MSQRTLWILAALATALSTYTYLFEWTPTIWQAPGRVFPHLMGPDEVQEISLERPGRAAEAAAGVDVRPLRLRREGPDGQWWIVEPIRFPAFHPRVQSIAFELIDLTRIAEAPEATSAFAGGPVIVLKLKTRDGGENVVEIGADHPDPRFEFTYVRAGSSLFVTRKEFRKLVDVGLHELRSRALLGVPPSDAASLEVSGTPSGDKMLARGSRSEPWRLRRPLEAMADRQLVEEMLTDLNAWSIASFEQDGVEAPEALRAYGLEAPRAAITLTPFGGAGVTLEVGAEVVEAASALVYVRLRGEGSVFRADSGPTRWLFGGAEAVRARYLFDWALDEVVEISGTYRSAGDPVDPSAAPAVILRRQPKPTEPGAAPTPRRGVIWEALGPGGVKLRADSRLIEGQLALLERLLVQKFEAARLSVVRGKLTLKTRAGRSLEALLGDPSSDPKDAGLNMYAAMAPGEPTAVLVSTTLPPLLEGGAEGFRDRSVSDLQPETPLEIAILDGEHRWDLARLPGEPWMLAEGVPLLKDRTLDSQLVDRLLVEMGAERLRAVRFLPELKDFAAADLSLTQPSRGVLLLKLQRDEATFHKLILGSPVPDTRPRQTLARLDTPGLPPFTIEDALPAAFTALAEHLRAITGR